MFSNRWIHSLFSLITLAFSAVTALADGSIAVAVAANFARPLEEIKKHYENITGTHVKVTVASSGTLYAHLTNGAPYDVFLSADTERPETLHKNGHCLEPFEYARGRVVFWSKNKAVMEKTDWVTAARSGQVRRIAIANPKLAPYGMVALPVLPEAFPDKKKGPKMIYGQNVAQAFQFAQTGAVDGAFTSLSFALSPEGKSGRYWEIAKSEAVHQWGCIAAATDNPRETEEFARMLQSVAVKKIINSYGYH